MKLNLGAGRNPLDGYQNLDRKTGQEIYPLAFPDGVADEIRASHVLEHFSHRLTLDVLREWVRALKPGGVLKIAVPDFDYASTHRDHPHWMMWITGAHVDSDDCHGAIFTQRSLGDLMNLAGLVDLRTWISETRDCASLPVSLNLEGTKRA